MIAISSRKSATEVGGCHACKRRTRSITVVRFGETVRQEVRLCEPCRTALKRSL